jgi:hypothetical protein
LQDAEANRRAIEEIHYSEIEHSANPFRSDDQTAKAIYIKNASPALVEFCKTEAKDVEIPIFGRTRNLTVEGALSKDPATAALIKVAQHIHESWNADDKQTYLQQKAAAEEALRKLAETAAG